MRWIASILIVVQLTGCATLSESDRRMFIGAGIGGAVGAGGGAAFSPNSESRGLNALVFGLLGTIFGGLIGFLTAPKHEANAGAPTLREQEREQSEELSVPPSQDLPAFVRERLKPTVIESYVQDDVISEDGSLHEPHRVYRIKQPSQLIARPIHSKAKAKKGERHE